jgi:hypothetical protein
VPNKAFFWAIIGSAGSGKTSLVVTNLQVANVDPNTNDFGRVLAIIPVEGSNYATGNLTYNAEEQCPHFFTLPTIQINELELSFYDDAGKPIDLHSNFLATLSFSYTDPPQLPQPEPNESFPRPRMDKDGRSYKVARREARVLGQA